MTFSNVHAKGLPSGAQAPALPVDAIKKLIAKVPHDADHGRTGHPATWCERCALDAQLTALLAAAEEGRKDRERLDWLDRQYVQLGIVTMATVQTDHEGNHGEIELWELAFEDKPSVRRERIREVIDAARPPDPAREEQHDG